jgi:hypothetical protein
MLNIAFLPSKYNVFNDSTDGMMREAAVGLTEK